MDEVLLQCRTYIQTYILVVLISVGLAQAHPNYDCSSIVSMQPLGSLGQYKWPADKSLTANLTCGYICSTINLNNSESIIVDQIGAEEPDQY